MDTKMVSQSFELYSKVYTSFVPNFNLLPRFVIDKIPDF